MTFLKTTCLMIASASILALPSAAFAASNNFGNGSMTSAINGTQSGANVGSNIYRGGQHTDFRTLGGSSTASFYYRQGVRNFERGNLEKSDYAFRAVLRANGSKNMDMLTLHYLTLISDKQGDDVRKLKYAKAYFDLEEK